MYFACDPADSATLLMTLHEGLRQCPDGTRVYALVDTAFNHDSNRPKHVLQGALPLYEGPMQALQQVAPVLLPLPGQRPELDALITRLVSHRAERPMLSLILSPLDASALREQWQAALTCQTEDGQRFVLRFADTRIQPALARHLPEGAWACLSANVAGWLCVARDGSPHWLALPAHRPAPLAPCAAEGIPPLSDAQLTALLADSLPDTVIDALAERLPDVLEGGDPKPPARSLMHTWVSQACQLAMAHDVQALDEHVTLAAAALLTHGALLNDPRLPGVLARTPRDAQALNEALMALWS
jgi:hypothetical protein